MRTFNSVLSNFIIDLRTDIKEIDFDYIIKNVDFSLYDTVFDKTKSKYNDQIMYGQFVDNKLIGLACINKNFGNKKYFLSAIEINTKNRNVGYGKSFVRELESMCSSEGCEEFWITPLFKTFPFWEKLKYVEEKDTKYWKKSIAPATSSKGD